ncbi:hypothetical protein B566_EDAN013751 [Ephemera danica]|nr:hypothetical protein B566_EDAN013751 [Ephemera danica]
MSDIEHEATAVKLHNMRIYNPEPSAIHCMAFNASSQIIAVSRADSSVEIWGLEPTPRLQRRILPPVSWASVESLCWGPENRLFCCGLHGHVLELDLQGLCIKASISVITGACWCIDVHNKSSRIAAGTEEGYINFVDITPDGLQFNRILDKQEVRVWDSQSGHALYRLATGRDLNNKTCLVWCVRCLDDSTFVSGDSRGKLCIWDLAMGVSLEEHQALKQDVLCISVALEGDEIFCSGIEPRISQYSKLQAPAAGARTHWVRSHQRRFHSHDVRALACLGGSLLASGGAASVASTARLVLLRFSHHLELRQLASCDKDDDAGDGAKLLVRLDAKSEHTIACAAISEQANWIAYSTQEHAHFYTVENSTSALFMLEKVRGLPRQLQNGSFTCLQFSAREAKRAVVAVLHTILVLELNHQAASVIRRMVVPKRTCDVTAMGISDGSDELLLVYADHEIIEYNLKSQAYTEFSRALHSPQKQDKGLLNSTLPIVGLSFDPCSSRVLLHDSSSLYILNKDSDSKRQTIESVQVLSQYKNILHSEWLPTREILVLRVTQSQLEKKLPHAPRIGKLYGSHT